MRTKSYPLSFLLATGFIFITCISLSQNIAGGALHSMALCSDNTMRSWGNNTNGQLGTGTNSNSSVPLQVNSLTGITAIASGGWEHSAALKNNGTVWIWGLNNVGQFGNGTYASSNVPVQVPGLSGVTAVALGRRHSLALKNDGTVWVWGSNFYGQFGNGNFTDSNTPVQINSISGAVAIAAGEFHSLVLKNDGTVLAFGYNFSGQLGDNTNVDSNTPVPVTALTNVNAISAGRRHSLALKSDGSVWAWGFNSSGQLGNGNFTDSNVPVQVSSLTNMISISAGEVHSLALKNDGTVWSWGSNANGQLGNGTFTASVNLAVPVSSLTSVSTIAGGGQFSLALKNDNSFWAWGLNTFGQLGIGTTNTGTNTPVQTTGLCSVFTSVKDVDLSLNSVSVFPNPFNYKAIIKTNEYFNDVTFSIFNAMGQEVKTIKNISGEQIEIEREGLSNGIYFIKILENNKLIASKKLIVTD